MRLHLYPLQRTSSTAYSQPAARRAPGVLDADHGYHATYSASRIGTPDHRRDQRQKAGRRENSQPGARRGIISRAGNPRRRDRRGRQSVRHRISTQCLPYRSAKNRRRPASQSQSLGAPIFRRLERSFRGTRRARDPRPDPVEILRPGPVSGERSRTRSPVAQSDQSRSRRAVRSALGSRRGQHCGKRRSSS